MKTLIPSHILKGAKQAAKESRSPVSIVYSEMHKREQPGDLGYGYAPQAGVSLLFRHSRTVATVDGATVRLAPLREKMIYGRRLLIYRNVDTRTPSAVNVWADLWAEMDGRTVDLYDWKADFEAGTIYIRGAVYFGDGRWERFEGVYPCEKEEEPIEAPGRNFEWNTFFGEWRNTKTGKAVRAF